MAAAAVSAIRKSAGATRAVLGEERYEKIKDTTVTTWAAVSAFVPFANIAVMPYQIALMIVFILLFIFVFGMGWESIPLAYLFQGITIMLLYRWIMNKGLRWFLNV